MFDWLKRLIRKEPVEIGIITGDAAGRRRFHIPAFILLSSFHLILCDLLHTFFCAGVQEIFYLLTCFPDFIDDGIVHKHALALGSPFSWP